MISAFISRIVILTLGTLYPAYASYKAVRTKDVKEYVRWMMYWIVFALFNATETLTDLFVSFWFPFYYELKIIIVLWLLSPITKGSSVMYRSVIHPWFTRREQEIDGYIAKAKEQGYSAFMEFGSKGVNLATNVIVNTALKNNWGEQNQRDLTDDGKANFEVRENAASSAAVVSDLEDPMNVTDIETIVEPVKTRKTKTKRSKSRNRSLSRRRVTRSRKNTLE